MHQRLLPRFTGQCTSLVEPVVKYYIGRREGSPDHAIGDEPRVLDVLIRPSQMSLKKHAHGRPNSLRTQTADHLGAVRISTSTSLLAVPPFLFSLICTSLNNLFVQPVPLTELCFSSTSLAYLCGDPNFITAVLSRDLWQTCRRIIPTWRRSQPTTLSSSIALRSLPPDHQMAARFPMSPSLNFTRRLSWLFLQWL